MTAGALRPYQRAAADAMVARRRLYLAFAPRMGKTPTTIVAANELGVERPLVICPAIARDVWSAHWQQWGLPDALPHVVSYDYVRVHAPEMELATYDAVIIDEVHYAAHISAKRTRAAMGVANRAPRAELLAVLSGSPIRTRPFDLYPPLRAIWPDKLKAAGVLHSGQFRDMFECDIYDIYTTRRGYHKPTRTEAKNIPALRALLDGVMIRTTREQVAEQLPPMAWEQVPLVLEDAPAVRAALEAVPHYEGIMAAIEADEIPGAWAPHVATIRRILGAAKGAVAAQLIRQELDARLLNQVVVGAYHLDVLDVLERAFAGYRTVRIDGSVSPHARAQAIADFQQARARVMIAQLTAAGVAIDLSAADDILLVEQDWTPDVNLQFVDRIRSPNKERPCTVREYVVRGSIDAKVSGVCRRKLRLAGQIVYGDD